MSWWVLLFSCNMFERLFLLPCNESVQVNVARHRNCASWRFLDWQINLVHHFISPGGESPGTWSHLKMFALFFTVYITGGTNIRELLVDNGINVYRSVTRWTNCKGKQRCGTCIVDVRNIKYPSQQLLFSTTSFLSSPFYLCVSSPIGFEESWCLHKEISQWKCSIAWKSWVIPIVVYNKCVRRRNFRSPRSSGWSRCIKIK